MAIETGLISMFLMLLSLGCFQVSSLVARQNELQSAAAEGLAIALADKPDTQQKLNTIQSILMTSTGLANNKVTVSYIYRCGTTATMTNNSGACSESDTNKRWKFVRIQMSDTYTPSWRRFLGFNPSIALNVDRTVQIK